VELLFLSHRAPFPPDRGDRLRSFHTLQALARLGPVDVVAQADTPEDEARAREGLAELAREVHVFTRRKPAALAGMATSLLTGGSLTEAWHDDDRVKDALDDLSSRHAYDLAYAFSSGTGPWLRRARARTRIMDLCDLDALKWSALGRDGLGPVSLVRRVEGRRLLPRELSLAEDADLCLVSTRREADDVLARARPQRLEVLTQGASWQALADLPPPSAVGPVLGFLGQMDYPPNVRAVELLAKQVLPLVAERHVGASLRIMGRAPTPEVTALQRLPGVEVTGEVSSVREALGQVAVFCAPIDRGRGIPTKVVEAMAAGRATVLSTWAAGALAGEPGRDYLVAEGPAEMGTAAAELLADPPRLDALASAGQAYVRKQHDWAVLQDRLEAWARELVHA
jgi:sugar transferase (PEP-CTERM/EpsH1 system associated)